LLVPVRKLAEIAPDVIAIIIILFLPIYGSVKIPFFGTGCVCVILKEKELEGA
jgi:hypothetical protein